MYYLISRLHISDRTNKNNWKALARFIHSKIYELEPTKAEVKTKMSAIELRKKVSEYNKKFDTDFSA